MIKFKKSSFLILFLIVQVSTYFLINKFYQVELQHTLKHHTEELQLILKSALLSFNTLSKHTVDNVIKKPEILELVNKASKTNKEQNSFIKDQLYNLLLPDYNFLKKAGIREMQLVLPNDTILLNMDQDLQSSDNLSDSVKMSNLNKKEYHGLEKNKLKIKFHNTKPLFYNQKYIAVIETTYSLEKIENFIRKLSNKSISFIIKNNSKKKSNYSFANNFTYINNYKESGIVKKFSSKTKKLINKSISESKNFSSYQKISGIYYLLSFVSLQDIEGNIAAYIFSHTEEESIGEFKFQYYISQIISRILILLIFFLLYYLLRKENELTDIDSDYKDILDANNDIVFMVDIFGKQLYFNKQMESLYGYKNEEVIGKNFTKFIPKSEIPKYLSKLKEVFLKRQVSPFETLARHKNGNLLQVEITGKIIRYKGKLVAAGTIREISKRKLAEQELRKLSIVVEQSPASIMIVNRKAEIEYVNPRFCSITGYSEDEVLGKNPAILKTGFTSQEEYKILWQCIISGKTWKGEFKNINKHGKIFWESAIISPIKNDVGEIINFLGIKEDITKTKEIELALKESENIQRKILNTFNDGIYINSPNYEIEYVNSALEKKFGKNLIGQKCHKALFNLNEECSWCIYEKLKIAKESLEYELDVEDNKTMLVNNVLLENNYKLTTFHDITNRKQTEQELRKLSVVVEQSPASIVITDIKGNIEYVNPHFTKLTGYSLVEALGQNPRILKSKKTSRDVYKQLWKTIASGNIWEGEFKNIKKNGEEYWEKAIISPIKNNKGKIINYLAIKEDITEQKLSKLVLEESEQKFRLFFENNKAIMLEVCPSTRKIINANQAAVEFYDYSKSDLLGSCINDLNVSKQGLVNTAMNRILNDKSNLYQFKHKLANGVIKDVEVYTSVLTINKKKSIFTIIQDITEKKKVELALIENEKKFKTIFNNTNDGIILADVESKVFVDANKTICQMLGYEKDELIKLSGKDIHPSESLEIVISTYEKQIHNEIEIAENLPVKRKDGSVFYADISYSPISLNDEKFIIATFRDITERKQALQNLLESKEQLSKSQIMSKIGGWEINLNTNVITLSPEVQILIGENFEQRQMPFFDFVEKYYIQEDKTIVNNKFSQVLENINNLNYEDKFEARLHKQNKEIHYYIHNYKFKSHNILSGATQDITEKKLTEFALQESEAHYKAVFSTSMIGISIIDSDGIIIDTNPAAENLHGYPKEEVINKNFNGHIHPDDKEKAYIALRSLIIRKKKKVNIELRSIHKISKKEVWMEINASLYPSLSKSGKSLIIVFFQDISERINAVKELRDAILEADKANSLKSEFLANMSHEIRTPLNSIIGFSNILEMKLQDEKHRSFAKKIANSGDNLLELINDILDLSKIEAGQLEIQKEAVNPYSLFNDIPPVFSETTKKKNVQINLIVNDRIPKLLNLDSLRIKQVLFNLISNALKFTKKGSISVSVDTKEDIEPGKNITLVIKVKDTGIGIPENQIDCIFNSFRQVQGQSTRKHGGTGLGLSITKQLIELMNGSIDVISTVDVGSTFTVHLNNIKVLELEEIKYNEKQEHDFRFKNAKILHVEDNKNNREIIQVFLENKNIELLEAHNGKHALELLEHNKPDLIIMDILMPELNGFETTKIIRKNIILKDIPIIAISASASKEEITKYKNTFNDYLTKPINLNDLLICLKKYLPFEILENKQEIIKEKIDYLKELTSFMDNANHISSSFLKTFESDIIPLYKEVKDILDINDCKLLSKKLSNFSNKYKIETLKLFADELLHVSESFHLGRLKVLLEIFSNIIDIILKSK